MLLIFSGCANQDEMSEGTRKGAKGGALVGPTMTEAREFGGI